MSQIENQSDQETTFDLVVSPNEVSRDHGTGILILRLFENDAKIISIRGRDSYGGQQAFGKRSLNLEATGKTRKELEDHIRSEIGHLTIRHILCIPYFREDLEIALALKSVFPALLCTYIMDDNCLLANGITESNMRALIEQSDLLLAISNPLARMYEATFAKSFYVLPGLMPATLISQQINLPSDQQNSKNHGIMIGNIWSEVWIKSLMTLMAKTDLSLEWYGNTDGHSLRNINIENLNNCGVITKGLLPETALKEKLKAAPYSLLLTGSSLSHSDRPAITRLSLPSRISFISATAQTPYIVMGDKEAAVSRFVSRHDLGIVCDYHPESLLKAVAEISQPATQKRMRENAFALAQKFNVTGTDQWIWDSLTQGQPIDQRFQVFNSDPDDSLSLGLRADPTTLFVSSNLSAQKHFFLEAALSTGDSILHLSSKYYPENEDPQYLPETINYNNKAELYQSLIAITTGKKITKVMCMPASQSDMELAIALNNLYELDMISYIAEEEILFKSNISASVFTAFIHATDLIFVNSMNFKLSFEEKFAKQAFVLPALVSEDLVPTADAFVPAPNTKPGKRGLILAKNWPLAKYYELTSGICLPGYQYDWAIHPEQILTKEQEQKLQNSKIGKIELYNAEQKLDLDLLQNYDFAVVLSHHKKANNSKNYWHAYLPEVVTVMSAVTNIPLLAIGSKHSAIREFVEYFGLGLSADYVIQDIQELLAPLFQHNAGKNYRLKAFQLWQNLSIKQLTAYLQTTTEDRAETKKALMAKIDIFQRSTGNINLIKFFEPELPAEVWSGLKEDFYSVRRYKKLKAQTDFIIDIGSSSGIWSHGIKSLFPDARFILIDPLLDSYAKYFYNLNPDFEQLQVAVADKEGTIDFQKSDDQYGSSLMNPEDGRNYNTITVPVKSLDKLKEEKNIQGKGLMKIDVQGAEHLVLEGAKAFIQQVNAVILELSVINEFPNSKTFLEMLNIFDALGFTYFDDGGHWRFGIGGFLMQKDVMFVRKELIDQYKIRN